MKRLIRKLILTIFCLWLVTRIFPQALQFTTNFDTGLLVTSLVIMFLDLLIKPVINLILLPLNLITLGTFRWVTLIAVFWLADYILPSFTINTFTSPAFTIYGFSVPAFTFAGILSYVAIGLFINLIMSVILWLFK